MCNIRADAISAINAIRHESASPENVLISLEKIEKTSDSMHNVGGFMVSGIACDAAYLLYHGVDQQVSARPCHDMTSCTEGKAWQEKALNLQRALDMAVVGYLQDKLGQTIGIQTFIDYLSLDKIGELYMIGYRENKDTGAWPFELLGVKSYLESGCPGYKITNLLMKNGETPPGDMAPQRPGAPQKSYEQEATAYEQHSYRASQLMPSFSLTCKYPRV